MSERSVSEIEVSTDKLLQDLKQVVEDGEYLLKNGADSLADPVRQKLAAALASAQETGRKLRERAAAGAKAADTVIRDHPYHAVGVALAAGLLIGFLAARK